MRNSKFGDCLSGCCLFPFSLKVLCRPNIPVEGLDYALRQSISFFVQFGRDVVCVQCCSQVIANLKSGSSRLPAELKVFLIRIATEPLGDVGRYGNCRSAQLRRQNVPFFRREAAHQTIRELPQFARQAPNLQVREILYSRPLYHFSIFERRSLLPVTPMKIP